MLDGIKDIIRQQLHNRCYAKYADELSYQQDAYAQWILENENWKKKCSGKKKMASVIVCNMERLKAGFSVEQEGPQSSGHIYLFYRDGGILDSHASQAVVAHFESYPYTQVAYGDEDCVNKAGIRHTPWFKPQYSPDTLHSFAYYGNVLAIREEVLKQILSIWRTEGEKIADFAKKGYLPAAAPYLSYEKGEQNLYYIMLLYAQVVGNVPSNKTEKPVGVVDKVLYHRAIEKNSILSDEYASFSDSVYEDTEYPDLVWEDLQISETNIQQENCTAEEINGNKEKYNHVLTNELINELTTISIVIPSKDQPDVLTTCVESVMNNTKKNDYLNLELIVVDNGSTAHNRLRVEQLIRKYNGQYLYKPMEFNFSLMCNMGAARAQGEYLLFLNDDMEVIQADWLERMLASARLPHVGAVGAKLLYPDSDLIQHVGVTNLAVGPAHKLLKLHDENVYYHGQNRHNYDMIGVTAACLLIETKKFLQIDGFTEKLAVAYNDVELCFALYEAGYYNVQRNDVTLYHHESLSRGDDLMSEEKKDRLLRERASLYGRHPKLDGFDPFYSRHLAGSKHMYLCDFEYPYEQETYYVDARVYHHGEPVEWENNCLNIHVEKAKLQEKMHIDQVPKAYHIEGWSYVLDMDNSHYSRTLLLVGETGACYEVPVVNRYRKDVVRVLEEQQHVELAGFVCRVKRSSIPTGTYNIAMLVKDGTSKQYLYKKTDVQLVTECL